MAETPKPKILIYAAHYLPGFKMGGPVRSISNMVFALQPFYDFYIITSDKDYMSTTPYENIKVNSWTKRSEATVYYASQDKLNKKLFSKIMQMQFDVVYLNSFFSLRFSILPLLVLRFNNKIKPQKVVLAPRGEFSKGALNIRPVKKQLFLKVSKLLGLHKNCHWQVSSVYEKQDLQKSLPIQADKISIASNVPNLSILPPAAHFPFKETLKIISVGRVSPMKNITFALETLRNLSFPVEYNIYGAIDDQLYWEECQELISKLPDTITVTHHPAIDNTLLLTKLNEHHLFYLPTLGENFGHAIVEALSAGLPVLISDQTPWVDLKKAGVGYDLPLGDTNAFAKALEEIYYNFSINGGYDPLSIHNWIKEKIASSDMVACNKRLFEIKNKP